MIYSNRPLFMNPTGWLAGTLTSVGEHVVVTRPDGTVLSVQPDGSYQSRPAGTAGAYEVAQRDGDKLIYNPGELYVIAVVDA